MFLHRSQQTINNHCYTFWCQKTFARHESSQSVWDQAAKWARSFTQPTTTMLCLNSEHEEIMPQLKTTQCMRTSLSKCCGSICSVKCFQLRISKNIVASRNCILPGEINRLCRTRPQRDQHTLCTRKIRVGREFLRSEHFARLDEEWTKEHAKWSILIKVIFWRYGPYKALR
uniref:Uncharacterized protein n=1 Tax=Romanomermis culicivorax TaxID=13658 RepID=A0A915JFU6_ROMCU